MSSRAEELIADLEAEIVNLAAQIAELEAIVASGGDTSTNGNRLLIDRIKFLESELSALKAQQRGGVVLPERLPIPKSSSYATSYEYATALDTALSHNACLDEVARLNPPRKFRLRDPVRKTKGSQWSGRVVGFYSTEQTPDGYAVESFTEKGSVQIYPGSALEPCEEPGESVAVPCELLELERLRAFHRCCVGITEQLADSPKSAFARLVEAVKDTAQQGKAVGDE